MPKVKVEKIVNADREKIFNLVTDFENLPSKFPQFFKSMKILGRDGNTVVIEEHAQLAGRDIIQKTRHVLTPPEKEEVFITEGDTVDSHIITTYEKVAEGTKITIEGDFKLAGKLKLIGFLAKSKIQSGMNQVLDEFAKTAEQP